MPEAEGRPSLIEFVGEESHRFTRLAMACLDIGAEVQLIVDGREPLTSRALHLEGQLIGAQLDRYLRLVILEEDGSGIKYWVAGSNSIRSIATRKITFAVPRKALSLLEARVIRGQFIPGVVRSAPGVEPEWVRLDLTCVLPNQADMDFLLDLVANGEVDLAREAALALRAFAALANRRKPTQLRMEAQLLSSLSVIADNDTRIALVENLGYVGTAASLPTLSALIEDSNQDDHLRWAAGVAISRLPGDEVLPPLISLLRSSAGWASAGAMLGIARHATRLNQLVLEPVFEDCLTASPDSVLTRYACLGLARFDRLDPSTVEGLLAILKDASTGIDVGGFAALALSGCLTNLAAEHRSGLVAAVQGAVGRASSPPFEPELVWGHEFLAELAILLELNSEAAQLYASLADHFGDWRADYYRAVSLYQGAEVACQAGHAEDSLDLLQEAISLLRPGLVSNVADQEAINFRREIVRGRLLLQAGIQTWVSAIEADELNPVLAELDEVMRIYRRYTTSQRQILGIKRLSDREADYIRKSYQLIQILRMIVNLQLSIERGPIDLEALERESLKLGRAIDLLRKQFTDHLAEGPNRIVERCSEPVSRIRSISAQGRRPETYGALREQIELLRVAFWEGTWPMPARTCPVGGLGRGRVAILREDIRGSGTESDPYLMPANATPILNVVAEIEEMAPGGTCFATIYCDIAGRAVRQRLTAVEGSCRATLVLPDVLSPLAASRCDIRLIFEARDCTQSASELEVYFRRES